MSSGTVHFFISKIRWEHRHFDCLSVSTEASPSFAGGGIFISWLITTVSSCVSCLRLTWCYSWAEASMLRFVGLFPGVSWPHASKLIYPVALAASHSMSALCWKPGKIRPRSDSLSKSPVSSCYQGARGRGSRQGPGYLHTLRYCWKQLLIKLALTLQTEQTRPSL